MEKQKVILCYGDSNTWGYVPSSDRTKTTQRYSREERWPGLLHTQLGKNYYVIEEGLNGRTTNLDYHIPPDRNGKRYLPPCLYSHAPIDLIIFALGGNDFKVYFNRTVEEICNGMAELIDIVQGSIYGPKLKSAPQILLLPPPLPLPIVQEFKDDQGLVVFQGGIEKAEKLIVLYEKIAQEKKCHFLNVSRVNPSQIDGLHFDAAGHKQMADLIKQKVIEIL